MAKDQTLSNEEVTRVVGAIATEGKPSTMQEALLAALLEDVMERKTRKKTEEAQEKASRDANVGSVKQKLENDRLKQEQCPHKKPNGHPAIAGQRDHRQNYHWICLYCQKSWKNGALPLDLRISMDRVGGPNN